MDESYIRIMLESASRRHSIAAARLAESPETPSAAKTLVYEFDDKVVEGAHLQLV